MKDKLFKFFKLPDFNTGANQKEVKYKCGCGKIYGCASSLRIHVIKKHDGIRPPGTRGAVPRVRGRPSAWVIYLLLW